MITNHCIKIDKLVESPPEDNIMSKIELLRNAVKNCGDAKKESEASANATSSATTAISPPEPHQFVRQRTFSVEDQLNDSKNHSPMQETKELSSSMPVTSAQTRKSVSGTISITPRRFSPSMTYTGKPVSVVTAVQSQSDDRRRSSVFTTPTRLVRQSSSPNPRSTRTSWSRQSLSSPVVDEKPVVKPVPRKTIMKASNPIPSITVTKSLKLRVGEQTKLNGPLKAVTPFQRASTLPSPSESLMKGKRTVKTSTPLAPSNAAKASIPAASSTAVINTVKHRHCYTFGMPKADCPTRHQLQSQRIQRIVDRTRNERRDRLHSAMRRDKFSQSMIVGTKQSSSQPTYPLQRRRLSQSYGTNKENSVLHQK